MAEPDFGVEMIESPDALTVRVKGELDAYTVGMLRDRLEDVDAGGRGTVVEFDFSELSFLDSTGISLLISVHNATSASGGSLTIRGATGEPRRVLDVTGVIELLGVQD
jgi:anti-sigma B factor antagonist